MHESQKEQNPYNASGDFIIGEAEAIFADVENRVPLNLTPMDEKRWIFLEHLTGTDPLTDKPEIHITTEYLYEEGNGTKRNASKEELDLLIKTTESLIDKGGLNIDQAYTSFRSWYKNQSLASLNSIVSGYDDLTELGDILPDTTIEPVEEVCEQSNLKELLNEIISPLPLRERRVLLLRFGIEGGRTHTLAEVGKEFGLTRERIRQLEAKALKKLREPEILEKLNGTLTNNI